MSAQLERGELGFSDRADSVAEPDEESRAGELLERDVVDGLAVDEEMARGIHVGPGVGSKSDDGDVGPRPRRDRLLKRDVDLGISGIDEPAGTDRDRYVVDAPAGLAQEGRLVDSLALRVKRGISASNDAPFCRRNP